MPRNECKPLLDACGPDIYSRNPFRLLGTDVDQPARRIKRQEKELQAAIEIGELADEYGKTLRPDPLPTREELSQAARKLADVQQRFICEFFWFWPLEWGKSASDEVLGLLKGGNVKEAQKRWTQIAAEDGEASLVARHNLAVLGHWLALDRELKIVESANIDRRLELDLSGTRDLIMVDPARWSPIARSTTAVQLTRAQRQEIVGYWSFAFKHWEALCEDEFFWSMQADRIRGLDDARLTTGFLRRFSQSFPIAFDNINADLAIAYCDREMYASGNDHVQIMRATNAGNDDVNASLRRVTEPLQRRIKHAIETATSQLSQNKTEGKQRAIELFETVQDILHILQTLLGEGSCEYVETCGLVAETMCDCMGAYGSETKDWSPCIAVLKQAASLALDDRLASRIQEYLDIVEHNKKVKESEEENERIVSMVTRALDVAKAGLLAKAIRMLRQAFDECHDFDLKQQISSLIREMDIPLASAPRRRSTGGSGGYRNVGRTVAPHSTAPATEPHSTGYLFSRFIGIAAIVLLLASIPWFRDSCDSKPSRSHSSADSPSPSRSDSPRQRSAPIGIDTGLLKKIDSGEARVRVLKAEIGRMDAQLTLWKVKIDEMKSELTLRNTKIDEMRSERKSLSTSLEKYKRQIEGYESQRRRSAGEEYLLRQARDRHNRLVAPYNSLLAQLNLKCDEHNSLLAQINLKCDKFNTLLERRSLKYNECQREIDSVNLLRVIGR